MDGCEKNGGLDELKFILAKRQFIQWKGLTGYLPFERILNFILCSSWFFDTWKGTKLMEPQYYLSFLCEKLSTFSEASYFLEYIAKDSK